MKKTVNKKKTVKKDVEKHIDMVEMELDIDNDTAEKLVKYAREKIDNNSLITWAVNDILKGLIERKEVENG